MKFQETINEINRLIAATPYTREEIAAFWKAEDEKEWEPETLFAYAAAMEYMRKQGNEKEAANIRGSYEKRLDEIKEYYSGRDSLHISLKPSISVKGDKS